MPVEDLTGKIFVVTGGSSGIGRATARCAASAGATVVALARRPEPLRELEHELGDECVGISCDVTDPRSVTDAFTEIGDRFPRIDALLNVAGAMQFRRLDTCTDEDVAYVVGVNYLGPVYTTRAALPLLRAAGGGDILNVSSEATLFHMPFGVLYTSSKVALESFTTFMTRELRPEGIRVSLLRVGHTDTPIPATISKDDLAAALPALRETTFFSETGGAMHPDTVADTILFAITRPREQIIDVFHVRSFI